jgi:hypothetical protein
VFFLLIGCTPYLYHVSVDGRLDQNSDTSTVLDERDREDERNGRGMKSAFLVYSYRDFESNGCVVDWPFWGKWNGFCPE